MTLLDFLLHPILRAYRPSLRIDGDNLVGSITYEGEVLSIAASLPDAAKGTGVGLADHLTNAARLAIANRRALVTRPAPADDPHVGGLRVDHLLRAIYVSPAQWGDLVHRIRHDVQSSNSCPDRLPSEWGVLAHGMWNGFHLIPLSSLRDAGGAS